MVGPTSPSVFSKAWITLDALCPFGNISIESRDHPWAGKGHSSLCSSTMCPEEPKNRRWPGDTILPRATAVLGSQVSPTVHDTLLRALGIYYNGCALVTQYLCDDLFLCLSHIFLLFFILFFFKSESCWWSKTLFICLFLELPWHLLEYQNEQNHLAEKNRFRHTLAMPLAWLLYYITSHNYASSGKRHKFTVCGKLEN